MPFDYEEYQQKCNGLSTEALQKEWENYTRQIAGGATSTATSVLFSPLTAGVSLVGLGLSAPRIHNARKKREIIEKGLQARGATHNTRSRDVAGSMAVSGVIATLSMGLAGPLADAVAGEAVGKGVEYAVAHVALEGAGAGIEHLHDGHLNKKGQQELKMKEMQAQLANMQNQQAVVNNGQTMQAQYYQGQQMQFQQPALTTGVALPQAGILMQNQQQIQWQPQQGLLIPGMQQPNMVPGQAGFIPPMRPHSAAPDNQYAQYTQHQQQYTQQPIPLPQYHQVQQTISNQQPQQQIQHQQTIPNQPQQQIQVQPQYQAQQPDEKFQLHVIPTQPAQQQPQQEIYPNEKSAAYTTTHMQGDMTPLPLYSESVEHHERAPHPEHIDLPPAPTMEQEIEFLKAKLLQMEFEKRGMSATISGPMEMNFDGGPKKKEAEKPIGGAHEVSAPGQTPPEQQQNVQAPTVGVTRKNTLTSMTNQQPQSAPVIQTGRVASPVAMNQTQSAPSLGQNQAQVQQNVQHPQSAPPLGQNQSQPQHAQYAPVPSQQQPQYAQTAVPNQQQYAQQPIQQSQNHQRQGSLVSPLQSQPAPNLYEAETPVTQYQTPVPAPQQTLPQQQTQQTPIYQPQPVNAQLKAQQSQAQQQQPQYAPTQVSSPQTIPISQQYNSPQPQVQQQQQYQQNANCPPVQRQDSGYYSQSSTPAFSPPISRPVSSISTISSISSTSSISSPMSSRHQSISLPYSPHPQSNHYPTQQQQNQFNRPQQQASYNPQQTQQQYTPTPPQQQQQQQYTPQPQQQHQPYNPQAHLRSQSVAIPAPPPYFSPAPNNAQPVLAEKGRDYFGQAPSFGQPQQQQYVQQQQFAGQQQQQQFGRAQQYVPQRGSVIGVGGVNGVGGQVWQQQQWAPPPTKVQEPNYGPPPAVPGVWRG